MEDQCFILENLKDSSLQRFNLNMGQAQQLLLLGWSGYCAILVNGREKMPKSAPDAPQSPAKSMFNTFGLTPHR